MRDTFVKTLLKIAKNDPNVHIITGDLGFGVLKPFWEQLPNQITNVGIAEQNMTGFATGLALEGKIVFTYSIGNFPTLRTLEQIRNDAAYHNANVKIVCVGGGFVYGSLGMSHHATEDIAIMRSLPNVKVFAPGDLVEAEICTNLIYETEGVAYLRLGRGGERKIHNNPIKLKLGEACHIREGKEVAIFSTGAILDEVIEAYEFLTKENIYVNLYSFPTVKPIDIATVKKVASENKFIITVEEHNVIGGLFSAVSEIISKEIGMCTVHAIAINDNYTSEVGNQSHLRKYNHLSSKDIYYLVKKLVLDK